MKNRFYGDKKDYFKYGILDILSSKYESIGINWYLTDDNHGNQRFGMDIGYLHNDRINWRQYNPDIFDKLKKRVENNERKIEYVKEDNVVSIKYEFAEQLPEMQNEKDYYQERDNWHSKAKNVLSKCDLVFFDPDTGVKDKLPHNVIQRSEFATVNEINDYECDWLIIQFFQHRRRYEQLINNPIAISARKKKKKIVTLIHANVGFLHVTNNIDLVLLQRVFECWDTKISTQILIP
jgi:hypothetical protein